MSVTKNSWGKLWLRAISRLDNSMLFLQARVHAIKRNVIDLKITNNIVKSKVKAVSKFGFDVEIKLKEFSEREKKNLKDHIRKNAFQFAKINCLDLPIELYQVCKENKIKLLPEILEDDIHVKCTCKERFQPCFHVLAAACAIASAIEHDSNLIFKLRNFDFEEELTQILSEQIEDYKETIPYTQFITESKPDNENWVMNKEVFEALDYSVIRDIKPLILSLLTPNPFFHKTDFKSVVNSVYQDTAIGTKFFINQLQENKSSEQFAEILDKIKNISINLKTSFDSPIITYTGDDEKLDLPDDITYLFKLLKCIEEKKVTEYSPYIIALHSAFLFTLELIMNYAYVPQIFSLGNNKYKMRWLPAVVDDEVKAVFKSLIEITPPDIIQIGNRGAKDKKTEKFYQLPDEQLLTICSLLINQFMSQYVDQVMNSKFIPKFDKVFTLFFKNEAIEFSKHYEKEIPASIHLWLSKFHVNYKDIVPVLQFSESDNIFEMEILVENKKNTLSKPLTLQQYLHSDADEKEKQKLKNDIKLLEESFPEIEQIISSKGEKKLKFNSEQFVDVLLKNIPVIRLFGIPILLPKSLKTLIKPQVSLRLNLKQEGKKASFLNLENLLDFKWQIALGDLLMDADEFRNMINNMSGIVKIKDQFVLVKKEDLDKLFKNLANPPELSSGDLLKTALTREYQDAKIALDSKVQNLINSLTQGEQLSLPKNLQAELRPYQIRGYEWLVKNAKVGFGSIIADDMGLGKTLQVIAALLKFKQEDLFKKKKALVIVPTTLLTNWRKEIERFTPDLKTYIYHGYERNFSPENADVIITTYGVVRSDIKVLSSFNWQTVIIDEAQNIKNTTTDQTKAVKQLKADVRIAMTGTPVENRLIEYWSIFDFTNKGFLGNQRYFTDEFATPIQLYKSHYKLEKFKKITSPFIMRRLKSDKSIIKDLPDKIENNQYCSLTKEQAAIYQGVLNNIMTEIKQSQGINRRGLVLKLITSLKQICNHPVHYIKTGEPKAELSGKSELLFSLLDNIYENNEKVLIFTQYKEMGDLLVEMIEKQYKTEALFLHGGVPRKQRDEMVENFQTKKKYKTFILSLKAGGTGLNLTAACNVIHYDLWWNPAVEAQATDRAHRIGQTSNVMVYRLLSKGTFEEKIDEMIRKKKELAELTVSSGEKWIGELNNDDLNNIFKLD